MTGKTKAAMHQAALKVIERLDSDITPEEIARRAAEIRSEWTPDQEQARRAGGRVAEYTVPTCSCTMMAYGAGKEKTQ